MAGRSVRPIPWRSSAGRQGDSVAMTDEAAQDALMEALLEERKTREEGRPLAGWAGGSRARKRPVPSAQVVRSSGPACPESSDADATRHVIDRITAERMRNARDLSGF